MARRLGRLTAITAGSWIAWVLCLGVATAAVTAGSAYVQRHRAAPHRPATKAAGTTIRPVFTVARAPGCWTIRAGRRTKRTCRPVACRTVAKRASRAKKRTTSRAKPRRRTRVCAVTAKRKGSPAGFGIAGASSVGTPTGVSGASLPLPGDEAAAEFTLAPGPDGLPAHVEVRGAPPGTSGSVLLRLRSSRAGDLTLQLARTADRAGANGGLLSDRLQLRLSELSGDPIFSGLARDVPRVAFGRVAAGEERVVRLTLSFPDGGVPPGPTAGDNAFQGSEMDVDLSFELRTPG